MILPATSEEYLVFPRSCFEAISNLGFSFKVKGDPSFQPEEYCRISRTGNEDPTPRWGEKTILRSLLDIFLRALTCPHLIPHLILIPMSQLKICQ